MIEMYMCIVYEYDAASASASETEIMTVNQWDIQYNREREAVEARIEIEAHNRSGTLFSVRKQ